MSKSRSSRRMRNCKSRNKRGGGRFFWDGSCFDCSIIKRKFKKYYYNKPHKLCPYVNGLSGAEINALYSELNDKDEQQTERRLLIYCIAQNYKHDVESIPAEIESTIRSAIIKESTAVNAAFKKADVDMTKQKYIAQNPHLLNQSPVILSTGSKDHSTPDEEENPLSKRILRTSTSTSTIPSGGKSRRRHRRGRTLHKRRKSSKVRKIRRTRR